MSDFKPTPTSQDCQGEIHPMAVRGFELFNDRKYWLAHEALEEAWLDESGQIRHLYQGILQIGVTYYHVQNGNYRGAVKVFRRSQRWINSFPDVCRGIDVGGLRRDCAHVMDVVRDLGPERMADFDSSLLKPMCWTGSQG